jgi:NADPH2:quinone reductase
VRVGGGGGLAERVVAQAAGLWKLPDGADPAEAAAFRVAYLTAYNSIPRVPLNLLLLKGVILKGFAAAAFSQHEQDNSRRDNEELREHFAAGRLRPHIYARYPLDQVAVAMRSMQDREVIGKIVIDIRPAG